MIVFDTYVWVRYVTNDDHLQAQRALKLLERADAVFLPKTVVLELEWVLRAVYDLKPAAIQQSLLHILGLPMVSAEAPGQIAAALDYHAQGFDFADALLLAASEGTQTLYTFDKSFVLKGKHAVPAVKGVPSK
jgi:predicted nucleic-acid-binding protein